MGTISVFELGKAYKQYSSRWARLAEWIIPFHRRYHRLNWVLRDVSFEIKEGEAVGIIGENGAGKSTLLKLISGTTQLTTGRVDITGRVAALLELGMGFHPDFTGRQNALMAGQLIGYSAKEITLLMPEIEEFADIGSYIDLPVRVYSSGMQMRLAFSVATASRPDILIVDEALSVGDANFQHKSFARIREFKEQGTTLLIVSHDKNAIQAICERAILIDSGKIAMEGEPEDVFDYYNTLVVNQRKQQATRSSVDKITKRFASGNLEAEIYSVELLSATQEKLDIVRVGELITAEVIVRVNTDIEGLVLGFGIKDRLGQMIFGTNTNYTDQKVERASAGDEIVINVSFVACLGEGTFSVHCSLSDWGSTTRTIYHWIDRAKVFEVINTSKPSFVGCSWNSMTFDISHGITNRS